MMMIQKEQNNKDFLKEIFFFPCAKSKIYRSLKIFVILNHFFLTLLCRDSANEPSQTRSIGCETLCQQSHVCILLQRECLWHMSVQLFIFKTQVQNVKRALHLFRSHNSLILFSMTEKTAEI